MGGIAAVHKSQGQGKEQRPSWRKTTERQLASEQQLPALLHIENTVNTRVRIVESQPGTNHSSKGNQNQKEQALGTTIRKPLARNHIFRRY